MVNGGPSSATLSQHWLYIDPASCVRWDIILTRCLQSSEFSQAVYRVLSEGDESHNHRYTEGDDDDVRDTYKYKYTDQ